METVNQSENVKSATSVELPARRLPMADPLSITTSLVTMEEDLGKIISCCYIYLQHLKGSRTQKDASRIILESQALRNVLERLLDQITQDMSSSSVLLASLASVINGEGSEFKNCSNDLSQIQEELPDEVVDLLKPGDRLVWPLGDIEVVRAAESMHRLRSVFESMLEDETPVPAGKIQRESRELRERVLDFNRRLKVKIPDDQRFQVMLEWLDAPDPSLHHNTLSKRRVQDTGAWLLQGAEFEAWRDSTEMAVLWMHGIPGCGKSVLASSVVDYMKHFSPADGRTAALAYFYFQFSDQGTSTVDMMLRSLISQLLSWKGSPPATFEEAAVQHFQTSSWPTERLRWPNEYSRTYKDGISQPSTTQLVSILHNIIEELGEVFLVIDGLDECADQDRLHRLVDKILGWSVKHLHVFLTSRLDYRLDTIMKARNIPTVEVKTELVDGDIQLFIQEQLDSHPGLQKWPPESQSHIQESLMKGSQGMFRWVTCQIEVIAKCSTLQDLKRTLGGLPKSLSASYTSLLDQVDHTHWQEATRMLLWLAVSSQPLSIEAAVECLQDLDSLLTICSTLVTPYKVIRRRNETVGEFTELRLTHHTVKDYLLSDVFEAQFAQPLPFSRKEEVHEFVARTSISYLLSLREPLNSESLYEWPLSRHAAQFWPCHYIGAGSNPELIELAMRLLAFNDDTEQYRNLYRLYDPTKPWSAPNFDRCLFPDPLYYVSTCGLDFLLSRLLEEGAEPDMEQREGHPTCLQSAAYNGHHRVVELLLEAGTDPDAGDFHYDLPLKAATAQGHVSIMQLLLKAGANPNGSDYLGHDEGTPLLEACRSDNTLAVELLINARPWASPNAYPRGDKMNPLEAAAYRGSKECLRLMLLKAGRITALGGLEMATRGSECDVNMLKLFMEYVPDAVLQHAIRLGFDDLAGAMLNRGVLQMNIDKSQERYVARPKEWDYSPTGTLYCACNSGNFPAVRRLIQEGVDVNGDHESYGPSLAVAAYKGHLDIVKILIHSGSSLSDGNGIYGGPVQAAVLGDHLEVLQLLVSSGANINMPVGKVGLRSTALPISGSPLKAAVTTKNLPLMNWMLDHGADVHYDGGLGGGWQEPYSGSGSPLMIAASQGDLNVVDRLLKAGSRVNQLYEGPTKGPKTAIGAACWEGQVAVVERLLECGAATDLDDHRDGSGMLLFFAVKAGSLATVLLLLEKGVDPNALRYGASGQRVVLAQACKGENAEIVSALIEAGADVHKISPFADDNETPIQTAVGNSNAKVVRALIKHGGRLKQRTKEGFKALQTAIWKGSADVLRVLISEGQVDHSLRLTDGSRLVHHAARWNRPGCIHALAEAGADINSQDYSGKTPLHWASEHQGADALQWLLSNGADAGLADRETNSTPRDYAALRLEQDKSWGKNGTARILELLS